MPLTPEEEKKLREKIRKELEEREKRLKALAEKQEAEKQRKLEARLLAQIRAEEEERFYTEKGFVKYINRRGEVEWLTPEEAERRKSRKRTKKTSSRKKMYLRRRYLRWAANAMMIGFALLVIFFLYRFNPVKKTVTGGSLVVLSDVPGAVIFLDGLQIEGLTPDTMKNISRGKHFITVYKAGYSVWPPVQSVSILPGKIETVEFTLKGNQFTGGVQIRTGLPGVQLYVDGIPYQENGDQIIQLPVGYHTITPIKKGYLFEPRYRRVLVRADETQVVDFLAKAAEDLAYLTVSSNHPMAYVFLDNMFSGLMASGVKFPVTAGTYEVRVCANGYRSSPAMELTRLEAGEHREILFSLHQAPREHQVKLITREPGAAIIVNGEWLPNVTPFDDLKLSSGEHFINFMKGNRQYSPMEILIQPDKLKDNLLSVNF